MADSILDVPVPQNDWVELYAESGILAGTALVLQNKGSPDIQIWIGADKPADDFIGGFMILSYTSKDSTAHEVTSDNLAVWARATDSGKVFGRLSVQEIIGSFPNISKGIIPVVQIENDALDGLGASVEVSARGGVSLGVTLQDQTTEMLDLDFLQAVKNGMTLAADTVADSRDITLTAGHGMVTGDYPTGDVGTILEIGSSISGRFIQAKVLAVNGDVITLNQLVGDVFPIGSLINTGNRNLALADGSTDPVIFKVEPSPVQAGDITRIIIAIIGPTAMDFSTFGSGSPLPVGLLFRVRRPDGSYKNIRTVDRNLEGYMWGFDNSIFTPKTGNTQHGLAFRITFAGQDKHGVASRLDGSLGVGEQWEVVVLDDLVGGPNVEIRVIAEGSELQSD
jgi:hypothetical protein